MTRNGVIAMAEAVTSKVVVVSKADRDNKAVSVASSREEADRKTSITTMI